MSDNSNVNILLDPVGGRCSQKYLNTLEGKVKSLPTPEKKGYDFDGWFTKVTGGERVDVGSDISSFEGDELYAHWSQSNFEGLREQRKKNNIRKKQQTAIIIMAIAVVLLIAALIVVNYVVSIYKYTDVDGSLYYIKKKDGAYALFDDDNIICDLTQDGYYQTKIGTQLKIDPDSGEITDTIYVDDLNSLHENEIYGYSGRVLLFKQMTYDASSTSDKSKIINSISISNQNSSFTFKRGEENRFYIENEPTLTFEDEKFASLASACGYTLSMDVLKNPVLDNQGKIDLSEYGFLPEEREKTETDKDGNETIVKYDYKPATYTITAENGEWHRIIIGDAIVSDGGYYAMYDGGYVLDSDGSFKNVERRERVYILGTSGLSDGVLARLEDIITPMIIYPMSESQYFDVKDFMIYKDIDHDKILEELYEHFGDRFDSMTEEEISDAMEKDEEILKKYVEIFDKYSKKVCDFYYVDLNERKNTMNSYYPYVSNIEYTKGYYINADNINDMLYNLTAMEFVNVEKLHPTEEELEKYGLSDYAFLLQFNYHDASSDTEDEIIYVSNAVTFSKKNEDGQYYAYSETFDMVVLVDESFLDFLDWSEDRWYDTTYIQLDITQVSDIILESAGLSTHLKFDNSATSSAALFPFHGDTYKDTNGVSYSVLKNDNGKYAPKQDGKFLNPAYSGDYLMGGSVYTVGTREDSGYVLTESDSQDTNNDGYIDYYIHYLYDIIKTDGKYMLMATVVIADGAGNEIQDRQTIIGEPSITSEYFTVNAGYMFYANKDSALGKAIDEKYTKYEKGAWHKGNVFETAKSKKIIVDEESGEWAIVKSTSNPVFFGSAESSALIMGAAKTEDVYDNSGNIKTPGELYYPTAGYDLRYNEESGKVEKYTKKTGEWSNANANDCTIGIWFKGGYYVTEGRDIILVDEESGEIFNMTISTALSTSAKVYADGQKLNYEFSSTSSTGKVTVKNEVDNFREFYKGLVYGTFEGMADLSDEQMAELSAMDDFTNTDVNNPCKLKMTILAKDMYGNERYIVYRYYRYSERKAYLTVEVLNSRDTSTSNSNNAYGKFYVISSYADKIISDANKLLSGIEISAESKY